MTVEQKLARIKELAEQNPVSDAEYEAALDAILAELEKPAETKSGEQPAKSLIGAAIVIGVIGRVLR